VVLFADLANRITNVIYPRIRFAAVHDAVEFTLAPGPQSGDRRGKAGLDYRSLPPERVSGERG
jgi:hypothetical protein